MIICSHSCWQLFCNLPSTLFIKKCELKCFFSSPPLPSLTNLSYLLKVIDIKSNFFTLPSQGELIIEPKMLNRKKANNDRFCHNKSSSMAPGCSVCILCTTQWCMRLITRKIVEYNAPFFCIQCARSFHFLRVCHTSTAVPLP